jgi:hypothetical protein
LQFRGSISEILWRYFWAVIGENNLAWLAALNPTSPQQSADVWLWKTPSSFAMVLSFILIQNRQYVWTVLF